MGRRSSLSAALLLGCLLAAPARAQQKFSLFQQVRADPGGAKGDLYYTSSTSGGTISRLPIGATSDCLQVSGAGIPFWTNGCGTLGSVGLSMPGQFSVTGSPLTSNGTISVAWANQTAHYALMAPVGSSGAPSFRAIQGSDIPPCGAAGVSHAPGAVPDPGSTSGLNYFLRDDCTWAPSSGGTVTSVGLTLPSQFSLTGSPVTSSGTFAVGWNTQSANVVLAGPTFGGAAAPTFRALVTDDLPVFVGSGVGHSKGAVPDPGSSAGSSRYLNEDGTWQAPPGTGTVTDVVMPSEFSRSILGGDYTFTWVGQTVSKVWIGNGGGSPVWRFLTPADLPTMVAAGVGHAGGIVPDPGATPNGYFLKDDGTWSPPPGGGTVTSVDLGVPAGFTSAGGPVTGSGTLTLGFGSRTAGIFLAGPCSGTATASWRSLCGADIPPFTGSGASHTTGGVPDPGATPGTSLFLREDSSWALPPQGIITSLTVTVPSFMSVTGSPTSTATPTIGLGANAQPAHYSLMGPTSGGSTTPDFRALVGSDLPVFVASGSGHASGAVPDPGASAGAVKFLREDASWATPTFSSSIEVKESDASPDVTGVSVLAFAQTDGFVVTNDGGGQVTVGCPTCGGIGGGGVLRRDDFSANGSQTTYSAGATPITGGSLYVAMNGQALQTSSYSISGGTLTCCNGGAVLAGTAIAWEYWTQLPASSTQTIESFTAAGSTDFVLAQTPVTGGIALVSLGGLIQAPTSWSLIAPKTVRFSSAPISGAVVTASYRY